MSLPLLVGQDIISPIEFDSFDVGDGKLRYKYQSFLSVPAFKAAFLVQRP